MVPTEGGGSVPSEPPDGIPSAVATMLGRLANLVGTSSFRVFGGAALDLLDEGGFECRDIDVAFPYDPQIAMEVLASVVDHGGARTGPFRRYWMRRRFPVLMVTFEVDGLQLDLNFVDEVDRIGCFNLESVQWVSPEGLVIDPFDARVARRDRRAFLVQPIDGENPLTALARLLRLAAKYGLSLDEPGHAGILDDLGPRTHAWTAADDFSGREAWGAHLRALARVMSESEDGPGVAGRLLAASVPMPLTLHDPDVVRTASAAYGAGNAAGFWRAAGPSGPSERETQGPSGPSERETQGPSGPSERETQGPSGPSERETQGPSGLFDFEATRSPLTARLPERLRASHPLVGVVIPARNEVDYVGATIRSLAAQRRRGGGQFEPGTVAVVVVDNGSTDGTGDVVAECASAIPDLVIERVLYDEPSMVQSRAAGFDSLLERGAAAPPYLVSADADTHFPPHWLASVLAPLEDGCDMVVSSGWFHPELWERCPNLARRHLDEIGTVFFDPGTIDRLGGTGPPPLFTEQVFADMGRMVSDCGFAMSAALYQVLGGFYTERYPDTGREIPAVGWPLQFRAEAVGARIGWCRSPGYVTSPRRLLGNPDALFDGTAYTGEIEAFRGAASRHEWLDGAADRLDWDSLRSYVVKNYLLQRGILGPRRISDHPEYFGPIADDLMVDVTAFRAQPQWWSAAKVFTFADDLQDKYGEQVLAQCRASRQPVPTA